QNHGGKRKAGCGSDNDGDSHRISPSPVVHVRGLCEAVVEADLIDALEKFGPICYVMMMPFKRQALVEFSELQSADRCVSCGAKEPVYIAGQQAYFNYSTSKRITRPTNADNPNSGNKVLLLSIQNPLYPITTDVLYTVCNPIGNVLRIVIFKRNGIQAMVEFESVHCAQKAKAALNGADIYAGCCTLKIEYARPTRLNVIKNDNESWDYTKPYLAEGRRVPPVDGPQAERRREPPVDGPQAERRREPPVDGPQAERRREPPVDGPQAERRREPPVDGPQAERRREPPVDGPQAEGRRVPPVDAPQAEGRRVPPVDGPQAERRREPPVDGPQAEGSVAMVSGLHPSKMNCTRIFNLFCLYGNIEKVKFMKSVPGTALVEMGDEYAVDRAITHLNSIKVFGKRLNVCVSKQHAVIPSQVFELDDGSSSYKDFAMTRNNRFSSAGQASKNIIQPPSAVLHYYNVPPCISQEQLLRLCTEHDVPGFVKFKMFDAKPSSKTISGLLEFDSKTEAVEVLTVLNHYQIRIPSKFQ
uniref:Heteroous nuclear ribonucleoprotein L like n=1 Tax=Takifugu rubripes TaxID=31033 RepID=A0A674NGM3_TAKRU